MPDVLSVISSTRRRGAETFAVDLAGALDDRWQTSLLAASDGGAIVASMLPDSGFSLRNARRLSAEMASADVAIAHGSVTLPLFAATLSRTPWIYRSIGDPSYWLNTRTRRLKARAAMARAAHITVLWGAAGQFLSEVVGINPAKISVVPNGIPQDRIDQVNAATRSAARQELGLDPDQRVVVLIGSLTTEKRPLDAIRAIANLNDVTFLVAGEGPMRTEMEHLAAEMQVQVHFLGTVSDVQPVLHAADTLVLTSATEGLPGVLIEAGMAGIPAVSALVGGASEIVITGRTGWLVPPGDLDATTKAIQSALEAGPEIGQAARAHCLARFEIKEVAAQWDQLLTRISD